MATVYVFSGAAGANNGTSWADAYTSLASTSSAAAGDIVKVHKTHSQTTLVANINWANGTTSNPVRIICVDKDAADVLSTGALVSWSAATTGPQGNIYSYGMTWRNSAGELTLTAGTDGIQHHEGGTFALTAAGTINFAGTRTTHQWTSQNVDMSGATAATVAVNVGFSGFGKFLWRGGTYTCRSTQTSLFTAGSSPIPLRFSGVTFSGTVTNLHAGSTATGGLLWFDRCVMPTFTNVFATVPSGYNARVQIDAVSGTLSAPLLCPVQVYDRCGTVKALTAQYRTGGADDGEQVNAYSWEMASDADALDFSAWLESPPITRWVDSGASQTATVYVASAVTLQDDEFFIEVLSPSEAGSPTAAAKFRSTRALPLATPANLTTDGVSTWNGSGVGTKQKVTATISPTVAGPVVVRAYLAKASTTVYLDPLLDIA